MLVVAVIVGGCGGGSSVDTQQVTTTHMLSARQQATRDAQELLTLVRVPPSSKATHNSPSSRLDAPFEKPAESTLVDRHLFWRVGMTVDATAAWLRSHPPAGLTLTQNGSGGGSDYQTEQFGYEPAKHRADGALRQLQLELTSLDASTTGLRADGMAEWLDARPIPDTAAGPRMHVRVDGSCPTSARGFVGVTNSGHDLAKALVPQGAPTAGRVCRYDGANGSPAYRLLSDQRLDAAQAGQLATAVSALRLSHADGAETGCPSDDGSAAVVALRYAGGRDVDAWASLGGCSTVSNGWIVAAGTLPGLR
jgi:hypothetical protein